MPLRQVLTRAHLLLCSVDWHLNCFTTSGWDICDMCTLFDTSSLHSYTQRGGILRFISIPVGVQGFHFTCLFIYTHDEKKNCAFLRHKNK